jgi:hypothetical protein
MENSVMSHEPSVIALPLLEDCHSARIVDLACASLSDAAEYGVSNHGWQVVSLPLSLPLTLLAGKTYLMQLDLMEPDSATKLAAVSLEALLRAQGDPMSDLTVRRVVTTNYVIAVASLPDGTHVYEAVELVANRDAKDPAMATIQCYDDVDDDEEDDWEDDQPEWDEEDGDEDGEEYEDEDEDEYEDEGEDEDEEEYEDDEEDSDFEVEDEEVGVDGADEVDVEDPEEEALDPEPDGDGAGRAA